jgi:hypothetical protein
MPLYKFVHNLLNVFVQIAGSMPGQQIWSFIGNWLLEAHICCNAVYRNRKFASRYFLHSTPVAA